MAYPERAIPTLSPGALSSPIKSAVISPSWSKTRPLVWPLALTWLGFLALTVLSQSPAFRVYDAGWLPYLESVRRFTYSLGPNALLSAQRDGGGAVVAITIYLVVAMALLGGWVWAMRRARTIELNGVAPLLAMTCVLALPLVILPGLVSDDLYLYNLYGRTISVYGLNPIYHPPSSFPSDPHLQWVYWRDLPSSYGPIWLMLCAALSHVSADSVTLMVFVYRGAAAILHLLTVMALWSTLHSMRPRTATTGTIFYAWNPLVLLEVVGNAHNDVLVALFAVLLVTAAMRRAWLSSAFFAACAVMVKPYAVLLLGPIARNIFVASRGWDVPRRLALAGLVAAVTMLFVSLPLWAGGTIVKNVLANPASEMYTNTLWEGASDVAAIWFNVLTVAVQHPYLDMLRGGAFIIAAAWVLTRGVSRRDVADVSFRLWLVFLLTASWVWPWYFVPALALAPLAGAGRLPAATALTIGGLLFWTTWPERTAWRLEWLFDWRSVVLFGPVVLTLTWSPARRLMFMLLGLKSGGAAETDPGDVRLQTATG